MLSQEEDELRELLDLLESTFLTFSLAQFSLVPEKGWHKQYPKETKELTRGLALVVLAGH